MAYYLSNGGLIGPGSILSVTGVHDLEASRLQTFLPAGAGFRLYVPVAGDSYTLSSVLGSGTTGPISRFINSGFLRTIIHGQGRGVLGTGSTTFDSNNFQIIYDPTGTSNYTYSGNNDAFQPGTPHEMGGFLVNNTSWIGGQNNDATSGSYTLSNGTTYSWALGDGTVIVLLGSTAVGHAVFQYRIDAAQPKILKMSMSYTNTTSSSVTLTAQRGGDVDFDNFTTNNNRVSSELVTGTGQTTGKTLGVFCPGNGYSHNCIVSSAFTAFNPPGVVNGSAGGGALSSDLSIYCGWDLGTVAAGASVYVNCFYIVDDSAAAVQNATSTIVV